MTLLKPLTGQVSVTMAAPPALVWDLVSDVTRIGEFSPETFEAEWVSTGSTTEDGRPAPEVGARFRGHVKRNGVGPTYWSPCKVTVCEPGRVFEFNVAKINNWGYRLEPVEGGTRVTEYYRLEPRLPLRLYWLLLGRLRGRTNERGMRTTLERMRDVVEREAGR